MPVNCCRYWYGREWRQVRTPNAGDNATASAVVCGCRTGGRFYFGNRGMNSRDLIDAALISPDKSASIRRHARGWRLPDRRNTTRFSVLIEPCHGKGGLRRPISGSRAKTEGPLRVPHNDAKSFLDCDLVALLLQSRGTLSGQDASGVFRRYRRSLLHPPDRAQQQLDTSCGFVSIYWYSRKAPFLVKLTLLI